MPGLADSICDFSDDKTPVIDRVEVWVGIVGGALGILVVVVKSIRHFTRRRKGRETLTP